MKVRRAIIYALEVQRPHLDRMWNALLMSLHHWSNIIATVVSILSGRLRRATDLPHFLLVDVLVTSLVAAVAPRSL